jgi:hypothetical protein
MSLVAIDFAFQGHSLTKAAAALRSCLFISNALIRGLFCHSQLTARRCTMLRQVFVLIAAVHFYYGIYYDLSYIKFPPAFLRGGFFDAISRFKYLTFWNMVRNYYIDHTSIL